MSEKQEKRTKASVFTHEAERAVEVFLPETPEFEPSKFAGRVIALIDQIKAETAIKAAVEKHELLGVRSSPFRLPAEAIGFPRTAYTGCNCEKCRAKRAAEGAKKDAETNGYGDTQGRDAIAEKGPADEAPKPFQPAHYGGAERDVLDILGDISPELLLPFVAGNAFKYAFRMGRKKGEERSDQEKLVYYLAWLLSAMFADDVIDNDTHREAEVSAVADFKAARDANG